LDYFLQQVGPPLFEVVIYTHEQGMVRLFVFSFYRCCSLFLWLLFRCFLWIFDHLTVTLVFVAATLAFIVAAADRMADWTFQQSAKVSLGTAG